MSSSEETVQAKIRGGSPGVRSETTGTGFVKEVGFKPGVIFYISPMCPEAPMDGCAPNFAQL